MATFPIGEYTYYTHCRVCSSETKPVINLGNVPLAGGFLKSKSLIKKEKYYPLELNFCSNCFLLQTNSVINADTLFKNYFYFSSKINTLVEHFQETVQDIKKNYHSKNLKILEIGSNDGSFIKVAISQGFNVLGVDPATNVVSPLIQEGLPVMNDYFSSQTALKVIKSFGKVDVIFSSNTLAHIENIMDVFNGIKVLLANEGVLIFEVHYLQNLISGLQYDMIYHEHQYYYSVMSIQNLLSLVEMEVVDVKKIPIHGGSIRVYAKHKSRSNKVSNNVEKIIIEEKKMGLNITSTYTSYSKTVQRTKLTLLREIKRLKRSNNVIVGYGASGRGTILSNYCSLDNTLINSVIDDSPIKQGTLMPGTHVPIVDSNILYTDNPPDYVILFAWSFWAEIKKKHAKFLKNGGKFILPLPIVKFINE